MFIDNKYTRVYYAIINKARSESRTKFEDVYYESHHIIPKCMGGNEHRTNLVLLTAREHYLAHWLLCYMTEAQIKHKLQFAFQMMMNKDGNQKRVIKSVIFEIAKKHNREACKSRKTTKGFHHSDTAKKQMSVAKKGKIWVHKDGAKIMCDASELGHYISQGYEQGTWKDISGGKNPMYGKQQKDSTRMKISKAKSGSIWIHKGVTKIMCKASELVGYLADGYELGMGVERSGEKNAFYGKTHSKESMQKMVDTKCKTMYQITSPDGFVYETNNINAFARDNGLERTCLYDVVNGKSKQHKGYTARVLTC